MQKLVKEILLNRALLVVDDDFASNLLLTEYLQVLQTEMYSASSGEEAMELFNLHPSIRIVLMDVRVGETCGLALARRMKEIRPDTLVLAQTALAMDEDRHRIEASCCDAYLFKPIVERELFLALHRLLTLPTH